MTRKRFIKLLMSYGKQRNEAVKIAKYYHDKGFTYEKAYSNYIDFFGSYFKLPNFADVLAKAVEAISIAFQNASESIFKLANSFSEVRSNNDD